MELPPWLSSLSVPVLSAAVGGIIALLFLADYFRRKRAEVVTISHLSTPPDPDPKPSAPPSKHAPPKKGSQRSHLHHHSDKVTDCFSLPFSVFFFLVSSNVMAGELIQLGSLMTEIAFLFFLLPRRIRGQLTTFYFFVTPTISI